MRHIKHYRNMTNKCISISIVSIVWNNGREMDNEHSVVRSNEDALIRHSWSLIHRCIGWYQVCTIDKFKASQNAPVPYPTTLHSEQKCVYFSSVWSIVGYGKGAFWDLWIRSMCEESCQRRRGNNVCICLRVFKLTWIIPTAMCLLRLYIQT